MASLRTTSGDQVANPRFWRPGGGMMFEFHSLHQPMRSRLLDHKTRFASKLG
jgi:hypothetical protein